MGRRANRALSILWRERVERQRREGISVPEFCRREGISPPAFYAWRNRLKLIGRTRGPVREIPDARPNEQPLFTPVAIIPGSLSGPGLEIELPGGAVVRLPRDAAPELITAAIHAASKIADPRSEDRC